MTEQTIAFTLGTLPVYAYGMIVALAAALGFLALHFAARRIGLPRDTAVRLGLWAIPLGLLGGRALFVAMRWSLVVNELGFQQIVKVWDGGFALFGVIPGCLLAAFICAKRMRVRAADLMDAAAPGAALALAVARFAEYFTLQGVGQPVDVPALQWFPLAMQNRYGDWMMPVFLWEGIAALCIAWIAYRALIQPNRKPLDAALSFLLWLGVTQVLLESLRTDDILRLGLVKASQLAAMACILAVAAVRIARAVRAGVKRLRILGFAGGILIAVGVCVTVEFALDKSTIPNGLLYLLMALSLCGMAFLCIRLRRHALNMPAGNPPGLRER